MKLTILYVLITFRKAVWYCSRSKYGGVRIVMQTLLNRQPLDATALVQNLLLSVALFVKWESINSHGRSQNEIKAHMQVSYHAAQLIWSRKLKTMVSHNVPNFFIRSKSDWEHLLWCLGCCLSYLHSIIQYLDSNPSTGF